MNKILNKGFLLLLFAGILSGIISFFFIFTSTHKSSAELIDGFGKDIEADFRNLVSKEEKESAELIKGNFMQGPLSDGEGVIRLVMDSTCRLLRWSSSRWLPSPRLMVDLCTYTNNTTIKENNKTWFLMRTGNKVHTLVTLIPIEINFNIENNYLPPFIYLGRYQSNEDLNAMIREIEVHYRLKEDAAVIRDEKGTLVYCLSMPFPEIITNQGRRTGVIFFFVSVFFLLCSGFSATKNWKPFRREVLFTFLLLAFRAIMLSTGFPGSFVTIRLFSPAVLAIDFLSPSLGDLMMNALFLAAMMTLWARALNQKWNVWAEKFSNKGIQATLVNGCIGIIAGFSFLYYLGFFKKLILNSQINFEFSNVFSLDRFSFLGFSAVVLILTTLVALWVFFFRFSEILSRKRGIPDLVFPMFTGALCVFLFGGMDVPGSLVFLSGTGIILSIMFRTEGRLNFRTDLLNYILLTIAFSLFTILPVIRGMMDRSMTKVLMVADSLGDDRNLVTESLFRRVSTKAQDEAFIFENSLSTDSLKPDIAQWLKEDYFEASFKGYDVRIFVYDEEGNRVDKGTQYEPYLKPGSGLTLKEVGGIPTGTPDLYLVPYFTNLLENIYVGQFQLLIRGSGTLSVQVELFPNETQPNRLYPQLLLDDKVRNTSTVPSEFEFAIYHSGQLFRKSNEAQFPLLLGAGKSLKEKSGNVVLVDGKKTLQYNFSQQKTILIRIPEWGLIQAINLFSFFFYFFVFALVLVTGPVWIARSIRDRSGWGKMNLKNKIQVFLLSVSVLPLILVLFLLSPYIRRHIDRDLENNLRGETARIANLIQEDYAQLRKSGSQVPGLKRMLKYRLGEMEKTLFNDINIFSFNGSIYLTTQPSIYEMGLTSEYMDPTVFENLVSGAGSDNVHEEKIGTVSFFSGYYPLQNSKGKLIGFLNIPMLKNQDKVEEQSLGLLTFLVNLNVIIILIIGIIAVIISDSITRPLTFLGSKLKATTLGGKNEPIEWKSEDEIGEIIISYNQMLDKLADSEQKLARKERESAWEQMARQVAHEIKNPLTPMKLNIQHLVRAWKEKNPNREIMFDKVTNTLLVQIDSLVHIANSFSEFARLPEPQLSVFCIQDVIHENSQLYDHNLEGVQLELHLPDEEYCVNSDREQLSRVFNNLIKNAIQAIDHERGRIWIQMEVKGKEAFISIKDNGKGIPDEIREKIFEPNFSTKTSGMGLGLAIVKRIIENAGGSISFESIPGAGTTFHISLPLADRSE